MVSAVHGVWLVGVVYGIVSHFRPVKPISIGMFGLLVLPMILDGGTHMVSDSLGGLTTGFRYRNDWLASLTGHVLPESFYSGDAFGSFNSWMRLLTGGLFATGGVWFAFPLVDRYAHATVRDINGKMERVTTSNTVYLPGLTRPKPRSNIRRRTQNNLTRRAHGDDPGRGR